MRKPSLTRIVLSPEAAADEVVVRWLLEGRTVLHEHDKWFYRLEIQSGLLIAIYDPKHNQTWDKLSNGDVVRMSNGDVVRKDGQYAIHTSTGEREFFYPNIHWEKLINDQ